jgi:hypothetical protein
MPVPGESTLIYDSGVVSAPLTASVSSSLSTYLTVFVTSIGAAAVTSASIVDEANLPLLPALTTPGIGATSRAYYGPHLTGSVVPSRATVKASPGAASSFRITIYGRS